MNAPDPELSEAQDALRRLIAPEFEDFGWTPGTVFDIGLTEPVEFLGFGYFQGTALAVFRTLPGEPIEEGLDTVPEELIVGSIVSTDGVLLIELPARNL